MGQQTTRIDAQGIIQSIVQVQVDATPTKFAMVMPQGGGARQAIRIGLNLTAWGEDCFLVGDRVKYTVLSKLSGTFPSRQNLVKISSDSESR